MLTPPCYSIGLHMAFDLGETYFYGVADSGQTLPGHLLNSSSSGPAWLELNLSCPHRSHRRRGHSLLLGSIFPCTTAEIVKRLPFGYDTAEALFS
jgi:hypothetical protein